METLSNLFAHKSAQLDNVDKENNVAKNSIRKVASVYWKHRSQQRNS